MRWKLALNLAFVAGASVRALKRRGWNPGDPKLLVHIRMGRGAAMEAEGPGAGCGISLRAWVINSKLVTRLA